MIVNEVWRPGRFPEAQLHKGLQTLRGSFFFFGPDATRCAPDPMYNSQSICRVRNFADKPGATSPNNTSCRLLAMAAVVGSSRRVNVARPRLQSQAAQLQRKCKHIIAFRCSSTLPGP